jgi:phosphoribosylformimino-5-aminoimidazole carboxamide ribotide isomerase
MHILPAVDIKNGRAVRLYQGRADQETVYDNDPLNAARRWAEAGATYLHVVDLDGAFGDETGNEESVLAMARELDIPVEVGGGVRTVEKAKRLVDGGIDRVIVGTKAVDAAFLDELLEALPGRVNIGVDVRDGYVAVKGWVEKSDIRADDFLREVTSRPVGAVIYTDISRDGALQGPNVEAIRRAAQIADAPVIASGGVSSVMDVKALAGLPLFGIIIGKALYDGRITLEEAQAAVTTE